MNWGNSVWRLKVRGNHLGPSGPPARLEMDARQSLTVRRASQGNWFSITSGLSSLSFLKNREIVGWRRKVREAFGKHSFYSNKRICIIRGIATYNLWSVRSYRGCLLLPRCPWIQNGDVSSCWGLAECLWKPYGRKKKRHMKKNVSLVLETDQLLLKQKEVLSLVSYNTNTHYLQQSLLNPQKSFKLKWGRLKRAHFERQISKTV